MKDPGHNTTIGKKIENKFAHYFNDTQIFGSSMQKLLCFSMGQIIQDYYGLFNTYNNEA